MPHTLGYVVMRNSGMSEVCGEGMTAPGAAWLDFPAHTLDKTADTFLDVLVFHSDALPPVDRSHSITINSREYQGPFNRRCSNLIENSLQWRYNWNYHFIVTPVLGLLTNEVEGLLTALEIMIIICQVCCISQIESIAKIQNKEET